jgi:hypothetical protein
MAVFTKAEAKKISELDDYYMPMLDALKKAGVLDEKTHRRYMLTGYYRLVEFLQEKKLLSSTEAQEAMTEGFTSLVVSLSA